LIIYIAKIDLIAVISIIACCEINIIIIVFNCYYSLNNIRISALLCSYIVMIMIILLN